MKYGRAFVKLCLVLILCVGLGASATWAMGSKAPAEEPSASNGTTTSTTLECKYGDACNAVMEGWCKQNQELLDGQFHGKTLEKDPFFDFMSEWLEIMTLPFGGYGIVFGALASRQFYEYKAEINCQSQFCCFTDYTQPSMIGRIWQELQGQLQRIPGINKFATEYKKADAATRKKMKETFEHDLQVLRPLFQTKTELTDEEIDAADISDLLKQILKAGSPRKPGTTLTRLQYIASFLDAEDDDSALSKFSDKIHPVDWIKDAFYKLPKDVIQGNWGDISFFSVAGALSRVALLPYAPLAKFYAEALNFLKRTLGRGAMQTIKHTYALLTGKLIPTPYILQAVFDKAHASVDCWLCPLMETVFISGNAYASLLYRQLSKLLLAVLGIFAALTIMWMVFKVLVDFSGKESQAFIKKTFFLCLRIAIVAILLVQSPRVVGDLFFTPLIHLSTGLSMEVMAGEGLAMSHAHINYFRENFNEANNILGCTHTNPQYWTNESELMFSKQTCNAVVGLIQIMSIELTTPIQYGQAFMSYSFSAGKWWEIFPKFKIFFTGLFLVLVFVFLLVITPFKAIDIFVQLSVLSALTPLAIVLFAFPATRSYTKSIWKMFISCVVQLIMLSLMVAISIAMFTARMDDQTFKLFLMNKNDEAYQRLGLGSMTFLGLVAMAYISYKILDKAMEFASQLGYAVKVDISSPMAQATGSITAKTAGLAVGATAGPVVDKGKKFAKEKLEQGKKKVAEAAVKGIQKGSRFVVKTVRRLFKKSS